MAVSSEPRIKQTGLREFLGPVLQQPERLVEANSSAAWLHPDAWWDGGCPISHFAVHYRGAAQEDADWILVSSHVPGKLDEPIVLADLASGTWYVLLMVAHNDAGTTRAQVNFATLTINGGKPLTFSGTPTFTARISPG